VRLKVKTLKVYKYTIDKQIESIIVSLENKYRHLLRKILGINANLKHTHTHTHTHTPKLFRSKTIIVETINVYE
jgi:hypothetical protein